MNQKKHPLWWFDKEEEKYFPAGVAFYDDKYNEYRLKIDANPETQYYLKAVSTIDDCIQYRVEVVIKKNGKFDMRRPVGDGVSGFNSVDDVQITLCRTAGHLSWE